MEKVYFRAGRPGDLEIGDPWDGLRNYESRDLVEAWLHSHGDELPSERRLGSITAAFRQARSYSEASAHSDINVRPLLLYYGVLGLARGGTIALTSEMTEHDLEKNYGLRMAGWRDDQGIPDFPIQISSSGSFRQFVTATENCSLCRNFVSETIGLIWRYAPIGPKKTLRFDDILSRMPDFYPQYVRWRSIKCVHLHAGRQYTAFDGLVSYITEFFDKDIGLSKPAATFVFSYLLGMLVRYYPLRWGHITNGNRGDGALPTLLAAVNLLRYDFQK